MSERPIGTCSICGRPVIVPSMMVNPVPHCQRCGASAQQPYGPTIPMVNPKRNEPTIRWNTPDGYPPEVQS